MGSVGATKTVPAASVREQLVGQDTSSLRKYSLSWSEGTKALKEDFDLNWASDKQVEAVRRVMAGAYEYDKDYDKKPFKITDVDIHRLSEGTNVLVLSVHTEPDTPSAYLRMTDGKWRHIFIGKSGGMTTYGKKGGTVHLTEFEAQYWPTKLR